MNKIYNCDFLDLDIPANTFNLVILDLPYGQTKYDWDKKIDLNEMWKRLIGCCKETCLYIFFTTVRFGDELIESKPNWFKYDLVWEKTKLLGFLSAKKHPLRKHEMIYVFANKEHKTTYNPQMTEGKPYVSEHKPTPKGLYGETKNSITNNKGTRFPTSILRFASESNTVHGTQKPILLLEYLIKTYSNEGDNILDPTMGSGTTIIACINTKRNYVGVEKDKKIFNIAKMRIAKYIKK